jgi:hypothetical protein
MASMATLVLAGCESSRLTSTPTSQLPTAVIPSSQSPPYIHYTPSELVNIHLEFDYPSWWVASEARRNSGSMTVVFYDPRFLTLPTPSPEEFHPTPSDFGRVSVMAIPISVEQSLEKLVGSHRQRYVGAHYITALNDYEIKIDGYNAMVFEDQIDYPELYTSLMFERNIFFATEDLLYQIMFSIAENERGGEFEKGYEYFFNSLKIVP